MSFRKFQGLIAAAYTPMHADESLAPELVGPLLDYAVQKKFAALFVNGSTGEFPSLLTKERELMASQYVKESNGRVPIIVNVGSCSYEESIHLAEHAVKIGADAVCVISPFYFRPATARDMADFMKKIAVHCGDLPLYLYHAPGITGSAYSLYELLQIMLDEVPNFAGVKFTNENLYEFQRCSQLSDRIQMMFGRDEMLLGALAMGAQAGVGTTFNYLPKIYQGVIDAFNAGNLEEARTYMSLSHKAVGISARYGLYSIKLFMKFAGIDVGPMRSPVNRLSLEQEKEFRAALSSAGLDSYIG